MTRPIAAALIAFAVSWTALRAAERPADEPAIRADPRPADLTTGRRGSSDEPKIRDEPKPRDISSPRSVVGRATPEVSSLSPGQSEQLRLIRERAAAEIAAVHDRERAEIMAVLNEQQRAEYLKIEDAQTGSVVRRPATLRAPTTPLAPTTESSTP